MQDYKLRGESENFDVYQNKNMLMYIQRKVANMKSRLGTSKLHLKSVKENLKVKHAREFDETVENRPKKENTNIPLSRLE